MAKAGVDVERVREEFIALDIVFAEAVRQVCHPHTMARSHPDPTTTRAIAEANCRLWRCARGLRSQTRVECKERADVMDKLRAKYAELIASMLTHVFRCARRKSLVRARRGAPHFGTCPFLHLPCSSVGLPSSCSCTETRTRPKILRSFSCKQTRNVACTSMKSFPCARHWGKHRCEPCSFPVLLHATAEIDDCWARRASWTKPRPSMRQGWLP